MTVSAVDTLPKWADKPAWFYMCHHATVDTNKPVVEHSFSVGMQASLPESDGSGHAGESVPCL